MNEKQQRARNRVRWAKGVVHRLERELTAARTMQLGCEADLQRAIDGDTASWHNTPGILK